MAKQPQLQNLLNHKLRNEYILIVPIDFEDDDVVKKAPDYEEKPEWGLVISASDDVEDIVAGDVILYMSYGGTKVDSLGQDFIYVREEDVVSVHNGSERL